MVLSVPIYTIHRDLEIWGGDIEAFRPEQWFRLDQGWIQEMFYLFSLSPRPVKLHNHSHTQIALTKMILVHYLQSIRSQEHRDGDLQIFMATIFRRYTIVLEGPGPDKTSEKSPTH